MSKAQKRGTAKINQAWCDNAPAGTHTIGDGLLLICRAKGETVYRNYVLRIQQGGRRRDLALGSSRVVKLQEAKAKAAEARKALRDGEDVAVALGKRPKQPPKDFRVSAVLERYFESIRPSLKGGGEAGRWESPVKLHVLPRLGSKDVSEIDADMLEATFGSLYRKSPSTARKAFTRLRGAAEFAEAEGASVDLTAFAKARRRFGEYAKKRAEAGTRIASTPWQDLPDLYRRICDLDVTPARLALRLIILTGHRFAPVARAQLSEFDLEAGTWTVPPERLKAPFRDERGDAMAYRTPLSSEAARVVELAAKFKRGDTMFPAQRGAGVVTDVGVTKTLNTLGEAGRTHGFRATFKSWANEQGVSWHLSEAVLGHKFGDATSQAYERTDLLEQRREVMERWAEFVASERDAERKGKLRVVE